MQYVLQASDSVPEPDPALPALAPPPAEVPALAPPPTDVPALELPAFELPALAELVPAEPLAPACAALPDAPAEPPPESLEPQPSTFAINHKHSTPTLVRIWDPCYADGPGWQVATEKRGRRGTDSTVAGSMSN